MNVQAYYHKSQGIAEVCVSVLGQTIDIDRIEIADILDNTFEVQPGTDPTITRQVRFSDLNSDQQEEAIEQAVRDYCNGQGNEVTEYHTYN